MRTVVILAATVAVGLSVGFISFARGIVEATPPANPKAEGIVVFTGGSARIDGALQLLAEGRAERLLISGVNPAVGEKALAGVLDTAQESMLACCVDLGHTAQDTIGNAAETRDWATERGYDSLIVVTSDYHMPRSLAELADAMPTVKLIAYPVSNPELRLAEWWHAPAPFGLLLREYAKYLLTATRLAIAGQPAAKRAGG